MNRRRVRQALRVAPSQMLAAGIAVAAVPAFAQEPPTVGELVVTATKREERLRDVPLAASVISAETLEQRGGVTDPGVLLQANAGVRFNNLGTPTTSEVSIRGSGTARATAADSGVGLYRNGMYVAGGIFISRNYLRGDLFDLQRAEVLRGTLGALYGRNAVGGAVNLISAQPGFTDTGYVQLDYNAEFRARQAQAVANFAISDTVAVRLGLDSIDQDRGAYFNRTFGFYQDRSHGYVARAQARFRGEKLDTNLLLEKQELTVPPVPFQIVIPPSAPNFPLGYSTERYAYDSSIPPHAALDMVNVMWTSAYDLDWAQLNTTVGYRDRTGDNTIDNDGFTVETLARTRIAGNPARATDPGVNLTVIDRSRLYYLEGRLSGEQGDLRWMVGGDYLRVTSNFRQDITRTPFLLPPRPPIPASSTGTSANSTLVWRSAAAYASLTYAFSERVTLLGEARYTRDEKDAGTFTRDLATGTVYVPLIERRVRLPSWSYNAVLTYKPIDAALIYAKVGSGYRVGGFNAAQGDPREPVPIAPSYDNERSTTYEVGIKGNLGPRLYVAVAAYRTRVEDVLVQLTNGCFIGNPICPVQATNFVSNSGTGRVQGIEVEMNGRWQLLGGQLLATASASRQYGKFREGPLRGIAVPQTPDYVASANVNFERPLAANVQAFLNVNYSAQWGGLQEVTLPPVSLDDRGIFDLRTGLRRAPFEVAVYVKNLNNDQYKIFTSATSVRWPSDVRNWGFQFKYRW